jgi:hypothetical protein
VAGLPRGHPTTQEWGVSFQGIFSQPSPDPDRAKFLSRVFGIFSETIVELWARDGRARYASLGRPTISVTNAGGNILKGTLDFTLEHRNTRQVFIAEMKCEIEYQGFKYFILQHPMQLDHHDKPGFAAFKEATRNPRHCQAKVSGKFRPIDGGILIWGAATQAGKKSVMNTYGFCDVLTVEEMCCDLVQWGDQAYKDLTGMRRHWCNELFDGLGQCH